MSTFIIKLSKSQAPESETIFREDKKGKVILRTWNNDTIFILHFLQLFFVHIWVANYSVAGLDVADQVCSTQGRRTIRVPGVVTSPNQHLHPT
jgi:hypothetical protein